jgi:hypothetical protein
LKGLAVKRSFTTPLAVAAVIGLVLGVVIGVMLAPLTISEDNVKIALWLEIAHRICTGVGGLGTLVAMIFVARQFRLLEQSNRASTIAELYSRFDSFKKLCFEHATDYDRLDQAFDNEDVSAQRSNLHRLCELGFTCYEEIYKHHKRYGLLDDEDWDEWQRHMKHFFSKRYVRVYWNKVKMLYSKGFQTTADAIVQKADA